MTRGPATGFPPNAAPPAGRKPGERRRGQGVQRDPRFPPGRGLQGNYRGDRGRVASLGAGNRAGPPLRARGY